MSFNVFLFLLLLQPVASCAEWKIGQQVHTESGIIMGHEANTSAGVSEYLGIKFAKATDGPRRFMAPQKYTSHEVFNASDFSAECPNSLQLLMNASISDDCLSVNVWTKPQSGDKVKAVMIWIHGGGFSFGGSSDPETIGARLAAEQDVVVASFNYRTNIFGFPGSPDVPDSNPALLDQRLAIEWIRDNIAGFRGDPERMIIFGQSAGAASVDYYSFIWREDPIVRGFIQESGSASLSGPFASPPLATRHAKWFQASTNLGCGGAEAGSATVTCMQNKTVLEILNALPTELGLAQFAGDFGPTYDNKTVFEDYQKRAKEGNFIRRPLLIGANNNESSYFAFVSQAEGYPLTAEQYNDLQNGFNCPNDFIAQNRRNLGINAWRYYFMASFANYQMIPGVDLGAFHTAEIPLIFNTTDIVSTDPTPDTDGEAKLEIVMQNAWGSFARDPKQGLVKFGWPLYDSNGSTLIRLGFENTGVPDFVDSKMYDGMCIASSMGN